MDKDLIRLMILLETVFTQSSMIRFDLKHRAKFRLNNVDRAIESLIAELKLNIKGDKAAEDYLETMSILYLEILREFDNSKDPKMALALFQAANQGLEISVDGKPVLASEPEYLIEE